MAMEAKNGSQQAKLELYEKCADLIEWATHKAVQRFPTLDYDDVRQEFYLVFEKCIPYFNPEIGKFSTLFMRSARHRIAEIYSDSQLIRIKRTVITYRINKYKGRYNPKNAEETINRSKAKTIEIFPMKDEKQENPLDIVERKEMQEIVHDMLRHVHERYRNIIKQYYGIGTPKKNLDEIAEGEGVTREAVRQLRKNGEKRLKKAFEHFFQRTTDIMEQK